MTRGGAKRIILPCVGFAINPFSFIFKHMSQPVELSSESLITKAFKSPFPLIRFTRSDSFA